MQRNGLLPEAYAFGLCYALNSVANRPSFLDGAWSPSGFASFFPRAFLYKTPITTLALAALAALAAPLLLRSRTTLVLSTLSAPLLFMTPRTPLTTLALALSAPLLFMTPRAWKHLGWVLCLR
ncbi:hypothetical protein T484DRAFT_1839563 [Baffinella frigidus]|nr:hypothetical protein T484DRAFT_1839563 [Cryptophyta sp. CCMP2293]